MKRTLILFVFLFGYMICYGQSSKLDQYIKNIMQERRIPGLQLAIIQHGKIVKLQQYGLANIQDSISVNQHTLFPINSITKAFVGVAVMQLVEQGKLDLEKPVSAYLDSLPGAWQAVKIKQLLSHQSGLPEIFGDEPVPEGEEKTAWKNVQTMPMQFKPGESFSYNQTNYLLIGKIIDKLSGKPFAQFIQEKQLDAAALKTTCFGDAHTVIRQQARSYTFFHKVDGKTIRTREIGNVFEEVPPFLRTAAGMNSNAEELAKWIIALQAGKLLQKNSLQTLWKPTILNNGKIAGFSTMLNGYALGWPVAQREAHPALAPIGGGRSAIFVYPQDDLTVIVLSNMQGSSPESFMDEIAGHFVPGMLAENGFGLPPAIQRLRSKLLEKGFAHAIEMVKAEKKKNADYTLAENEVNAWGYLLVSQKKPAEALEIFKLNVYLYPKSGNAYDSLAEAYQNGGHKALAIYNYEQSLKFDPKNSNAIKQIELLRK
ncbi:serine hydrolase [Pedobacter montanisoli]|uniref:Beta-lactamase family protein n=1 Tax=Pedobacter montanisoli TaxID=2923277 RepID=A0ABS9ZWN0_9SPHI|nr:serine hydrolase [Pedobacter montanisoli]MCJ0742702.1 beta-lactamase family protein [Pedobacter montanisoli]